MTVHEVSRLTGVSVRALQYYDRIGLLRPAGYTEAGYRLYDGGNIERLGQIMLFRELEFPRKEIGAILDSPDFDRGRALEQQIELLRLRREHIEKLITQAEKLRAKGEGNMDFKAFDKSKIEEYERRARAEWGGTQAYKEYERNAAMRGDDEQAVHAEGLMEIFARIGALKNGDPASDEALSLVGELREYITAHWYTCTPEILAGLGKMYAAGGEFTENIDAAGGKGTAEFAAEAISAYCAGQ